MSVFGTGILDRPSKSSVTLVEFSWGNIGQNSAGGIDRQFRRFTDVEGPQSFLGKRDWVSTPSMDIDLPSFSGTLAEEKASITLPLFENTFTDYISDGMPFAPVRVHIMEVVSRKDELIFDPTTERPEIIHLFKGAISMGIRHPSGKRNRVRIEAKSVKSQLHNTTLGVLATNTCAHPFGGTGCFFDLSQFNHPTFGKVALFNDITIGLIVDGTQIQVGITPANLNDLIGKPAGYWDEGFIEVEGLRMKIRRWEGPGTNTFYLVNQPRAALVGVTGSIIPGCDKSLTNCRFYNNEEFFGGYGYGIPDYNPLFEVK